MGLVVTSTSTILSRRETGFEQPGPPWCENTLTAATQFLQNAGAIAFVLLGVATAVGWARHRDRTLGFLPLAIVLLALVLLLGPLPMPSPPPPPPHLPLLIFIA